MKGEAANKMNVIRPVIAVSNRNLILLENSESLQPPDYPAWREGSLGIFIPTNNSHC